MTKQQLIEELETTPDFVIKEVYDFLLFLKQRVGKRINQELMPDSTQQQSDNPILNMADEIIAEVPPEEWEKVPKDFAKNLDYYLYGQPQGEE